MLGDIDWNFVARWVGRGACAAGVLSFALAQFVDIHGYGRDAVAVALAGWALWRTGQ